MFLKIVLMPPEKKSSQKHGRSIYPYRTTRHIQVVPTILLPSHKTAEAHWSLKRQCTQQNKIRRLQRFPLIYCHRGNRFSLSGRCTALENNLIAMHATLLSSVLLAVSSEMQAQTFRVQCGAQISQKSPSAKTAPWPFKPFTTDLSLQLFHFLYTEYNKTTQRCWVPSLQCCFYSHQQNIAELFEHHNPRPPARRIGGETRNKMTRSRDRLKHPCVRLDFCPFCLKFLRQSLENMSYQQDENSTPTKSVEASTTEPS